MGVRVHHHSAVSPPPISDLRCRSVPALVVHNRSLPPPSIPAVTSTTPTRTTSPPPMIASPLPPPSPTYRRSRTRSRRSPTRRTPHRDPPPHSTLDSSNMDSTRSIHISLDDDLIRTIRARSPSPNPVSISLTLSPRVSPVPAPLLSPRASSLPYTSPRAVSPSHSYHSSASPLTSSDLRQSNYSEYLDRLLQQFGGSSPHPHYTSSHIPSPSHYSRSTSAIPVPSSPTLSIDIHNRGRSLAPLLSLSSSSAPLNPEVLRSTLLSFIEEQEEFIRSLHRSHQRELSHLRRTSPSDAPWRERAEDEARANERLRQRLESREAEVVELEERWREALRRGKDREGRRVDEGELVELREKAEKYRRRVEELEEEVDGLEEERRDRKRDDRRRSAEVKEAEEFEEERSRLKAALEKAERACGRRRGRDRPTKAPGGEVA